MVKGPSYKHSLKVSTICEKLAQLLEAGIPLVHAIDVVKDEEPSSEYRVRMDACRTALSEGQSFLDACAHIWGNHIRYRLDMGCEIPRVSTYLSGVSRYTLDQYETARELRSKMRYPVLLFGCLIVSLVIIGGWMLPNYSVFFNESGVEAPLAIRGLLGVRHWIVSYWEGLLIAVCGVFAVIGKKGKPRSWLGGPYSEHIDVFWVLGVITSAGVNLKDAVIGLKWKHESEMAAQYRQFQSAFMQTGKLSTAMESVFQCHRFDIAILATAEKSGHLSEALLAIAQNMRMRRIEKIDQIATIAQPVLIGIMGMIVAVFLVITMLPVLKIIETIA